MLLSIWFVVPTDIDCIGETVDTVISSRTVLYSKAKVDFSDSDSVDVIKPVAGMGESGNMVAASVDMLLVVVESDILLGKDVSKA